MKLDKIIETAEVLIEGTVGNRKITFDLLEELSFDFETLNDEIRTQARKCALVEAMHSKAQTDIDISEIELKKYSAGLWKKFKETLTDPSGKTLSDLRITKVVEADEELLKMTKQYHENNRKVKDLKNALIRFKERKDLLQTFASNVRNTA